MLKLTVVALIFCTYTWKVIGSNLLAHLMWYFSSVSFSKC